MTKSKFEIYKQAILNMLLRWEAILFYIFIIVIIFNSYLSPYFLDVVNLFDTTFNFMEKAIIALPMMYIIICGDIDISVASTIALCSVFMGLASSVGVGTIGLLFIGLATGAAAGFLNGIIITKLNIPAIAVTIGTYSLYRGIPFLILGDKAFTQYPETFAFFGQGYLGNTYIPFQFVLFIIMAIIFGIALHKTTYGRKLFAIGNNATCAKFSGVNVDRIRLYNFILAGLCAGIASILLTSRIASTRPNIASGWELEIITSVVLGGVSIMGGVGNIFGVVIAVFLLGIMKFGMGIINIPGKVMNIMTGALLIIAIMLPGFINNLKNRIIFKKT